MMGDLLLALHLLGAVLWVGGMGFALLVLRPAAHEVLQAPERLALAQAAFRRFFLIASKACARPRTSAAAGPRGAASTTPSPAMKAWA